MSISRENLVSVYLEEEMKSSCLDYSMSVITACAMT